jgi:uncharacterized membrane protein YqjE
MAVMLTWSPLARPLMSAVQTAAEWATAATNPTLQGLVLALKTTAEAAVCLVTLTLLMVVVPRPAGRLLAVVSAFWVSLVAAATATLRTAAGVPDRDELIRLQHELRALRADVNESPREREEELRGELHRLQAELASLRVRPRPYSACVDGWFVLFGLDSHSVTGGDGTVRASLRRTMATTAPSRLRVVTRCVRLTPHPLRSPRRWR